jgi:hypothetical protein
MMLINCLLRYIFLMLIICCFTTLTYKHNNHTSFIVGELLIPRFDYSIAKQVIDECSHSKLNLLNASLFLLNLSCAFPFLCFLLAGFWFLSMMCFNLPYNCVLLQDEFQDDSLWIMKAVEHYHLICQVCLLNVLACMPYHPSNTRNMYFHAK